MSAIESNSSSSRCHGSHLKRKNSASTDGARSFSVEDYKLHYPLSHGEHIVVWYATNSKKETEYVCKTVSKQALEENDHLYQCVVREKRIVTMIEKEICKVYECSAERQRQHATLYSCRTPSQLTGTGTQQLMSSAGNTIYDVGLTSSTSLGPHTNFSSSASTYPRQLTPGMQQLLSTPEAVKYMQQPDRTKQEKEAAVRYDMLTDRGTAHIIRNTLFCHTTRYTCLFYEYAARGDLTHMILKTMGRLEEVVAREYFRQLLEGVAFLHSRGVCHRNIRPQNLLLMMDGTLKIGGFGQAVSLDSLETTMHKDDDSCAIIAGLCVYCHRVIDCRSSNPASAGSTMAMPSSPHVYGGKPFLSSVGSTTGVSFGTYPTSKPPMQTCRYCGRQQRSIPYPNVLPSYFPPEKFDSLTQPSGSSANLGTTYGHPSVGGEGVGCTNTSFLGSLGNNSIGVAGNMASPSRGALAADSWGCGTVLYFMVTGHMPFYFESDTASSATEHQERQSSMRTELSSSHMASAAPQQSMLDERSGPSIAHFPTPPRHTSSNLSSSSSSGATNGTSSSTSRYPRECAYTSFSTWRRNLVQEEYFIPPSVSPLLEDLLCRLLEYNGHRRLPIEDALQHEWVTGIPNDKFYPLRTISRKRV